MTGPELIDELLIRTGLTSDMALAKRLQITRSCMSKIRKEGQRIGPETARRMALILKINPLKIQGWSNGWMAETQTERNYWMRMAAAAVLVLCVVQPVAEVHAEGYQAIHYATHRSR